MISRLVRSLGALLLIGLAVPALAGSRPKAVVELFTSQGCSSCPPADELLVELAGRPDILALTLPVDYWDYLGWKDTLAQPAFTARQRAYASARNDKQVYTPQVVVNGLKPIVGSDRTKIEGQIAKAAEGRGLPVAIALNETGSAVSVAIDASADASLSGEAWLLPIAKSREVTIARGENKGRTVTYNNVVRRVVHLGNWTATSHRWSVPLRDLAGDGVETAAVIVQAGTVDTPGFLLGAAVVPLR